MEKSKGSVYRVLRNSKEKILSLEPVMADLSILRAEFTDSALDVCLDKLGTSVSDISGCLILISSSPYTDHLFPEEKMKEVRSLKKEYEAALDICTYSCNMLNLLRDRSIASSDQFRGRIIDKVISCIELKEYDKDELYFVSAFYRYLCMEVSPLTPEFLESTRDRILRAGGEVDPTVRIGAYIVDQSSLAKSGLDLEACIGRVRELSLDEVFAYISELAKSEDMNHNKIDEIVNGFACIGIAVAGPDYVNVRERLIISKEAGNV